MTKTTEKTLTERVSEHWHKCLDVNSSWVDFTNEIGILNTLYDGAGTDDAEWLVELFQENEEFEEEDALELLWAIQDVAKDFKVSGANITSYDLENVVNLGFDAADVAEQARAAGVREEEINEFEDEVELATV